MERRRVEPTGTGSAEGGATSDAHRPSPPHTPRDDRDDYVLEIPVSAGAPSDPASLRTRSNGDGPDSRPPGDDPASDGSLLGFVRELPVLLLVAFVLAFLLRTFVVQVFYIPSESMVPTLEVNDRMIVEKITYVFRAPERGEIVVFEGEDDGSLAVDESSGQRLLRGFGQFLGVVPANARDFVKRVIGVPGDEVHIVDGVVHVNGEPIAEPYVRFGDDRSHGPIEVPEGKLFFLGDNRPNSSDSRFSLGLVDMDQVVGRAVLVIWPPEHFEYFDGADYDLTEGAEPPDAPHTPREAVEEPGA